MYMIRYDAKKSNQLHSSTNNLGSRYKCLHFCKKCLQHLVYVLVSDKVMLCQSASDQYTTYKQDVSGHVAFSTRYHTNTHSHIAWLIVG